MTSPTPPDFGAGLARVRQVSSFHELATTPFAHGVNAFCLPRTLAGDFEEVARALETLVEPGINAIEEDRLASLAVGAGGRAAIAVLREDLRRLREYDLQPELSCIRGYQREKEPGPVPTDVYSWHADSATCEADTWLCTYHGAWSEGLLNEEATHKVDVPETRAELLRMFGGADGEEFREWLNEHCFDLHYAARPGARPYGFGLHHLWRVAVEWEGSPVAPCIHRAPETLPGMTTRLLLLS